MTQYLIAIAVGPVQEFIASARKLRDLWYGSYLLSELSKSVACSLLNDRCELIFPAPIDTNDLQENSLMNVANKLLALTPPDSNPESLAKNAHIAYDMRWESLCQNAMKRAPGGDINTSDFQKQIHDFGEFFAAWYPYDEKNYQACRTRVEEKLTGRKTFRPFKAPAWKGEGKLKSSLDGIRESVIKKPAPTDQCSFSIKKGETLDALGVVKRFGPWTHSDRPYFDNLAQVAIQPYLAGLLESARQNPDIAGIISDLPQASTLYSLEEQLPPISLDIWDGWPETLPPELLHPAVLEAEKNERQARQANPAWQDFERKLGQIWKKTAEPHPYAALLLGDGDNMGAALDMIRELGRHQQFSQQLDAFSRQVHETVKNFEGRVIYSGGDDVMAYVPLHQVLDCAHAVNKLFSDFMESTCKESKISKKPTFSIGVAVVHHHKPLHETLRLARKAEKLAKQEGGRDALAIIQDKRSGSELMIHGKWQSQGELPGLINRFKRYVQLYDNGLLSSRLGYQLRALAKEYRGAGETEGTDDMIFENGRPTTVLAAEALRVIRQKMKNKPTAEAQEDLLSLINGQRRLRALSDELIISHQLYTAIKHSQGKW
jgi:CRISPR-associated protein Cmr2